LLEIQAGKMRANVVTVTSTDPAIAARQEPELNPYNPLHFIRRHPWSTGIAILLILIIVPAIVVYRKYSRIVDETLRMGPFANSANIFSAPSVLVPGEQIDPEAIVTGLERAGYSRQESNPKGWYRAGKDSMEVHPGPQSFFQPHPVQLKFKKGAIAEMVSLSSHSKLDMYQLEPELITNIVGDDREKRRLVTFNEIPSVLVHAVVATEDKRFFDHMGFDPFRLAKAAWVDAKSNRKEQGASTITMQLARGLWLDPEKRWRRKFSELMITLVLEHRLSKKEIFQHYANQVYLGRNDTFSIHGFGEAARTLFNEDVSQLTLPQAALLAGIIQRPSYFNPARYPARARDRRNIVLRLMQDNGYITAAQYAAAVKEPVQLAPRKLDAGDAPYFIALLNEELQERLANNDDATSLQVYSSLDPELQRAAVESVRLTMPKIDALVRAKKIAKDGALPQVALVAMDPHTGEVRALVGGRDYSKSQLNHALSMRQPGSIFKPFVYAAALNTGLDGSGKVFTEASTVVDEPAIFRYAGGQTYEPSNFHEQFYGVVTLRRALSKSMNLATVSLAEKVGYDQVVNLAKRSGLNDAVQATPAVALGAYEATPLEMAGAYTPFANRGEYVRPTFITKVMANGQTVLSGSPTRRQVLDPRVTFLMDDLLQEVIRSGTAAGARSLGFKAPAAGKTGTSRDGWFAGFTPDLLCVVWIGFDDNRELQLEGSKSALLVWTDFMKRAVAYHPVRKQFDPPPRGIVSARVDSESGLLAADDCGPAVQAYFIAGTQPHETCQPQLLNPLLQLDGGAVTVTSGAADRYGRPQTPLARHE
jgi:penicillin-binding protein 1B